MKNLKKSISLLSLALVAMILINCGGGGSETPAEKVALEQLKKKTWTIDVDGAKLGSTNRTSEFTGFSLTFSGTYNSNNPAGPYTFTVSGARPTPSPWPSSDQWFFINQQTKSTAQIERVSDEIPMVINFNTPSEGKITVTFLCPDGVCNDAGAKTSQVSGSWSFVLK